MAKRNFQLKTFFINYHPLPWRDSISRPIALIYWVAVGDITLYPAARAKENIFIKALRAVF
jgi:hypothetical protein